MLANFPLKYTDNNELMRKYFRHKVTKQSKTLGFGLDSIENYSKDLREQLFEQIYNGSSVFQDFLGLFAGEVVSKITSPKNLLKLPAFLKNLATDQISKPIRSVLWN
jgi:hypothetical protein